MCVWVKFMRLMSVYSDCMFNQRVCVSVCVVCVMCVCVWCVCDVCACVCVCVTV